MNRVSIGVICGAVAYLAGVFGVVSMTWGEPIHRKAFAVAIFAFPEDDDERRDPFWEDEV